MNLKATTANALVVSELLKAYLRAQIDHITWNGTWEVLVLESRSGLEFVVRPVPKV
jgi:hypothetical protein